MFPSHAWHNGFLPLVKRIDEGIPGLEVTEPGIPIDPQEIRGCTRYYILTHFYVFTFLHMLTLFNHILRFLIYVYTFSCVFTYLLFYCPWDAPLGMCRCVALKGVL